MRGYFPGIAVRNHRLDHVKQVFRILRAQHRDVGLHPLGDNNFAFASLHSPPNAACDLIGVNSIVDRRVTDAAHGAIGVERIA